MKPRRFDYARPDTVDEAVALLAEHGDEARVLAGGQSLMAMLNLRLAEPAVLIDIARIAELDTIRDRRRQGRGRRRGDAEQAAGLAGAGGEAAAARQALPFVGHFQTRNKGTVCGSIAHADPSSEIPLALATLDGEVVLRSQRGERVLMAAADFQLDMLTTAREPDELIIAVRFPVQAGKRRRVPRGGAPARRFRHRRDRGDVETCDARAASRAPRRRRHRRPAGGAADRRRRRRRRNAAFEALAWELEGYEDLHASARLRRDILRKLGPVVIAEALQCAA